VSNQKMHMTQSERDAKDLIKLFEEDPIQWYREEVQRVERRANWANPEVRFTAHNTLRFLRDVIAGREAPVMPPPPTPRSSRLMDVMAAEAKNEAKNEANFRGTLTLGGVVNA